MFKKKKKKKKNRRPEQFRHAISKTTAKPANQPSGNQRGPSTTQHEATVGNSHERAKAAKALTLTHPANQLATQPNVQPTQPNPRAST
jgi:hypothetical protein